MYPTATRVSKRLSRIRIRYVRIVRGDIDGTRVKETASESNSVQKSKILNILNAKDVMLGTFLRIKPEASAYRKK